MNDAFYNDDELDFAYFRLNHPERDVFTERIPTTRRIVPEVEAIIDRTWDETTARPGVRLFDGPVCRFENFSLLIGQRTSQVTLTLSCVNYRVSVGTNFEHPELADHFGPDVMANPLGVSAGLISADGYLVFGRRNASVAYYPNMLHPFAGSVEVRDAINVFDDCRRELREEVGLLDEHVRNMRLIGLVEDRRLRHPEAIFRVESTLAYHEIQRGVDPAEHGASEAWSYDVDGLSMLLRRDDVTPVGRAIAQRLIELRPLSS